jgi:hypothetical protein
LEKFATGTTSVDLDGNITMADDSDIASRLKYVKMLVSPMLYVYFISQQFNMECRMKWLLGIVLQ